MTELPKNKNTVEPTLLWDYQLIMYDFEISPSSRRTYILHKHTYTPSAPVEHVLYLVRRSN